MKNTAMEENIKNALELLKKSADLFEQAQKVLDEYGIQFLTPPQGGWCLPNGAKYQAQVYFGINKLAEACGAMPTHPVDYWKNAETDKLSFVYGGIHLVQRGEPAAKEYVFK